MAVIEPQQGPQAAFLATGADIAIYGGAAGGGKTWALAMEPVRHIGRPGFSAVIFRRNAVQVRAPGGLWDESAQIYSRLGGTPRQGALEWTFETPGHAGSKIKFAHLEYEKSVLDWQGSQIAMLGFDELTHFSRSQFFYMLSRNRSTCGIRPYVRATCNPDADSWVAEFIAWWIDPATGKAIPERSGTLRWMIHEGGRIHWADTPEELIAAFGPDALPKSVTFIGASLADNAILMEKDPGYLANLKALPQVERERLLHGNWNIRPAAGLYFRREWVKTADALTPEFLAGLKTVRYWDLAATEKMEGNDPDFTVSVKMGRDETGRVYVLHGMSMRQSAFKVREAVLNLAEQDGKAVMVGLPQDPGQAGKSQAKDFCRLLSGHTVRTRAESGDKATRFGPFSAQCEAGNVIFLRGDWNEEFFRQLEGFPEAGHDDHADACAGAFNVLSEARSPMRFSVANLGGRVMLP